jgi:hypothetical protein
VIHLQCGFDLLLILFPDRQFLQLSSYVVHSPRVHVPIGVDLAGVGHSSHHLLIRLVGLIKPILAVGYNMVLLVTDLADHWIIITATTMTTMPKAAMSYRWTMITSSTDSTSTVCSSMPLPVELAER